MGTSLGDFIRERREALELTQEEAADIAGVSKRAWGNWERGERRPREEGLNAIADALGVPPDEVYEAAGEEPPELPRYFTAGRPDIRLIVQGEEGHVAQVIDVEAKANRAQGHFSVSPSYLVMDPMTGTGESIQAKRLVSLFKKATQLDSDQLEAVEKLLEVMTGERERGEEVR